MKYSGNLRTLTDEEYLEVTCGPLGGIIAAQTTEYLHLSFNMIYFLPSEQGLEYSFGKGTLFAEYQHAKSNHFYVFVIFADPKREPDILSRDVWDDVQFGVYDAPVLKIDPDNGYVIIDSWK